MLAAGQKVAAKINTKVHRKWRTISSWSSWSLSPSYLFKMAIYFATKVGKTEVHLLTLEFVTISDVLLGSTEYSTSLDMWGVGCIFVEMVTGMPTFPGIRDTYDQLDKIFKLLGTPTEDTWPGVTHFPGYKPHKLGK